jgi:hypothetical protein
MRSLLFAQNTNRVDGNDNRFAVPISNASLAGFSFLARNGRKAANNDRRLMLPSVHLDIAS